MQGSGKEERKEYSSKNKRRRDLKLKPNSKTIMFFLNSFAC